MIAACVNQTGSNSRVSFDDPLSMIGGSEVLPEIPSSTHRRRAYVYTRSLVGRSLESGRINSETLHFLI